MFATYNKPYLSLSDQIELLKTRGLQFADEAAAKECLHRNGYYRLSAYWYPFRQIASVPDANGVLQDVRTDQFLPDSHFENAQKLYVFDKDLKLILLDAIERVEIAVRAEIALCLGSRNIYAYDDQTFFRNSFTRINPASGRSQYGDWRVKFDNCLNRSRDMFVLHHRRKYGRAALLPIWIAIELWDFGLLSHFFRGMQNPDQDAVASRFFVAHRDYMTSWLRSLNFVRNVIAHHGRLWNLNLVDNPSLPRMGEMVEFNILAPNAPNPLPHAGIRLYATCCILSYFSRVINPQSEWHKRLADHIRKFPVMRYASIQDMGFPADWESHVFWN